MSSQFNFNEIKRPVILLILIPTIALGILTTLELNNRTKQLQEAEHTEKIINFTQKILNLSHHFTREVVAILAGSAPTNNWQERTDSAFRIVKKDYRALFNEEEASKLQLNNYFKDIQDILSLREDPTTPLDKTKLLSVLQTPRTIINTILIQNASSTYQQSLRTLNSFVHYKEDIYLEGIIMMQTLNANRITKKDFETLINLAKRIEEFKISFSDAANEDQFNLYQQQISRPYQKEIKRFHDLLFLRISELELIAQIGYVGFIHHFKNYVIRGDEKYHQKTLASYENAISSLNDLKRFEVAHAQIKILEDVLGTYVGMLPKIRKMHLEKRSIRYIDQIVRVDDTLAESSLKWLEEGVLTLLSNESWHKVWENQIQDLSVVKKKILDDIVNISSQSKRNALTSFYSFILLLVTTILGIIFISHNLYNRFKSKIFEDFNTITNARKEIEDKNLELEYALVRQESNSHLLVQMMSVADLKELAQTVINSIGDIFNIAAGAFILSTKMTWSHWPLMVLKLTLLTHFGWALASQVAALLKKNYANSI